MPNRPRLGRQIVALVFFPLFFPPLRALAGEAASSRQDPICSVITVAPGDGLDALFGHTALRIEDPALEPVFGSGDVWFDYGVFDPTDHRTGEITPASAGRFILHYAKGDAAYLLVAADPRDRLAGYEREGRRVFTQELELTPVEMQKIERYLIENLRHPEYEYRFLDDNCTTRMAKAVEQATGRPIKPASFGTCRHYTDLYLSRRPLVQIGANWLMGRHAEQATTVFLPGQLYASIARSGPGGRWKPLPDTPGTLAPVAPPDPQALASRQARIPAVSISAGLFLLLAIPTFLRWRKRKPLPGRACLDAALFAWVGLVGCLMSFLGLWSLHPELGAFNWNLIWCWPTHLLAAVFFLFAAHGRPLRLYLRVTALGTGCAALAYFCVPQALPAPLFPLVLLLGLRAWRWGWAPEAKTEH